MEDVADTADIQMQNELRVNLEDVLSTPVFTKPPAMLTWSM